MSRTELHGLRVAARSASCVLQAEMSSWTFLDKNLPSPPSAKRGGVQVHNPRTTWAMQDAWVMQSRRRTLKGLGFRVLKRLLFACRLRNFHDTSPDSSNLPPRIFRNASIEDLDKFKSLEVQESHTCDLQPSSNDPQRLGDVNALEVKGPRTHSRSLHLEVQEPHSLEVQASLSRTCSRSTFAEATMSVFPMISEPTLPRASDVLVEQCDPWVSNTHGSHSVLTS